MGIAKFIIFLGIYCILSGLAGYIYLRFSKRTSSLIPFLGSVLIVVGNLMLLFAENYTAIYALSFLLIPFDSGIINICLMLRKKLKN